MNNVTEAAAYTLQFINQTQKSVFLTGKAGTGKTTLLREIIATTHKNTVVVAPTGIAALNAGGVTIHSMFQLPFSSFIPTTEKITHYSESIKFENKESLKRHFKMNNVKRNVIKNMELLVIDEVSMLRADLLDAINYMMQTVRKSDRPFGGVQVLYIGDLLQLPPVIKDEEWHVLKAYYSGKFFFHSHVIQQYPPLYIELSKIYRQNDDAFITILNNLRNNEISKADLHILNKYVKPDFDFKENKGYITLTTHNAKADTLNSQALEELNTKEYSYEPSVVGDFPEKIYPVEESLKLKVGAQVMFIKNDLSYEKRYFNGKMGTIKALSPEEIFVHFADENKTIEVEKFEWKNIRYKVNDHTKEVEEEVLGTFAHYPLKLAWAITVHKSQGLTFEKAALDVSRVFAPGQAYVALSRLTSLNGLVLLSPIQMNGITNDQDVVNYALNKASNEVLKHSLHFETKNFILSYLINSFSWANLAQEWRNHKFSYQANVSGSEKSKHASWAAQKLNVIDQLLSPSEKFVQQLKFIFSKETVDLFYVKERVDAAYNYFYNTLDNLLFDIMKKMAEIQRHKKVKEYYEELAVLDDLQTKSVLQLMKAKLLIETVVKGEAISKEKLTSATIKSYKTDKIDQVRSLFAHMPTDIFNSTEPVVRYTAKKAKSEMDKIPKKTTVEETFDLWKTKHSVQDIALIRKLTVQTIEMHLIKLIQSKKIKVEEVLPPDKIQALKKAFLYYTEESLNGLKEQYGETFTWDELKMYKASIN